MNLSPHLYAQIVRKGRAIFARPQSSDVSRLLIPYRRIARKSEPRAHDFQATHPHLPGG
jgi:hypothetical protein